MVKLLQLVFIIMLFFVSKSFLNIVIGKRARKIILEKNALKDRCIAKKENFINIIIFLGFFLLALLNGYNFVFAIIFGGAAIGILKAIKVINKRSKRKEVLSDLLNISECLRVQISSQIPLGNALRTLRELCENKEFGNLITNVYLEYELSKFVILDSAETLVNRFDYPEIRLFISALNQQIQGTSTLEAFDNLISILREKYIEFLEDATKSKMAIMTLGVFGIVINIAMIGIYPVAVEAFNAMNVMLK